MAFFDKLVVFVLFSAELESHINYIGQIVHCKRYIKRSFLLLVETSDQAVITIEIINSE